MAQQGTRKPRRKTTRPARKGSLRAPRRSQAKLADKFVCYERAVQAPDVDAAFIARTFKRLRQRPARVLREDFCGTAALCAEWVKMHTQNRAWGIDLDERTLNWGIRTHLVPLGSRAAGVTLIRQDVRDPVPFKADAVAAFNFSYFIFKDRPTLRQYLATVRRGLVRDGILFLDLYGGPETMELREERTRYERFTYVWDQAAFNPITHEVTNHIHFEFPDGSALRRAFTYQWRLWQIPEIHDLVLKAGFRECVVYWEGIDSATSEGNGVFRASRKGDNAPAFVSYLLCLK